MLKWDGSQENTHLSHLIAPPKGTTIHPQFENTGLSGLLL
jgi:hypothetical protein